MLPVFYRTHISTTAEPVHNNSSLTKVSPCVGVRCHVDLSVGQVMGRPWAAEMQPRHGCFLWLAGVAGAGAGV